jgi:lipoic acid synthetase
MVGLGETRPELHQTFVDLRAVDCDILTLGQYLRPSPEHLAVERYYHPDEFAEMREEALALGFKHVESGPLVRSSYHARDQVPDADARRAERAERAATAGGVAVVPAAPDRRAPVIDADGRVIYRAD